jgi:signal transduction histidine kinase
LELLEERYADHKDLVRTAELARQTHDRLAVLVEEVKSFVRFEQSNVDMRPLSLAAVVHELLAFLRYDNSLPHERITSRVAVDAQVRGNRVKLQQVLINLLKNAADAIDGAGDGQIVVTVDAGPSDATLRVEDNGCGMPAEVAARIWEPFFTTKGNEGNGLGLDIVKQIIEAHGGRIDCQTSPGRGTAFVIRLPLDVPAIDGAAPVAVGYVPSDATADCRG